MSESHPAKEQSDGRWSNLTVWVCGAVTAFIGGLMLILWALGFFNHISPGQKFIPMADETALLFLVFGSALALYRKGLNNMKLHYSIDFFAALILISSLLILVDIGIGNGLNLRNFLGMQAAMVNRIQSGTMSFLSVFCFILISVSLLKLQRKSRQTSVIFSSLTLFIGYIVIVGYAYRVPILYGGYTIPMALLTALLFVISSIGLLVAAGKETYPIRYFTGDSVRASLLRIMIPAIFILSQLQGFLLSLYSGNFGSSFGLINGISSIFVLLISGVIIFGISRKIGTSIDNILADQKRAEANLRESEENFRRIFENNSAAIAIIEPDTTISMVNEEYCRISGYSREEALGMSWTEQILPEDLDRLKEYNRRRLINPADAPKNYDFAFYHRSGEIRYVVTSVTMLWDGKILTSFADITARKIEEQKLSHLSALVESSNDIIISQTLEGIITSWNKGAETICGYIADEMVGQPITALMPPETEDQNIQVLEKIKSGIVLDHFEAVRKRKDGQLINVLISISPIKNNSGEIIGASTIGHDISARKKMEEELRIKTEQLTKLNAEKDKFFSIVAHDLRSPFNGFLGLTEAMVNDLPKMTNGEVQEISLILYRSATNLYNLLGNLLEWSYMQRGFTNYVPESFLVHPKMGEILILTIEAASKKEIEIVFDIPEDLLVYADVKMFESIIRNITNNAVKFTPRGGMVTISAKSVSGSGVEISVQDTGIGMSKEMINNLFFIDVNTARKGTEGEASTGLGLIICKDFIEKHGGKLWVESEERKGSIFRFTLPSNLNN